MNGNKGEWAIGLHGVNTPNTLNDKAVSRLNQIFQGIGAGTMLKSGNELAQTTRQAYL